MKFEDKKNIGVILMAGKGERFSSDLPKQYLKFDSKELFLHSFDVFSSSRNIDFILLVVPEGYEDLTRDILSKKRRHKEYSIIQGALSREESAFMALKFLLDNNVNKESTVLIHDGDRPFVTRKLLEENINSAKDNGAALTAIPSTDSLAMMSEDKIGIDHYLQRSCIYQLQTPQTFKFSVLYEAFLKAKKPLNVYTDEGSLVIDSLGIKPKIVLGDKGNVKITFRSDARLFEGGVDGED